MFFRAMMSMAFMSIAACCCTPCVFAINLRPYLSYHPVDGLSIEVRGLYGFDYSRRIYHRLDTSQTKYRPAIISHAKNPKGGRIRFQTDSKQLHVPAEPVGPARPSETLSLVAAHGIDVYVNKRFFMTTIVEKDAEVNLPEPAQGRMNSIDLYLPAQLEVGIDQIGLTPGSNIAPPVALGKTVLFYGTSVEWAAGGNRVALTYPEIIARDLDLDFYNFAFPSNAWGEDEITETLAKIPCDLFVLSYTRNLSIEAIKYTGMQRKRNLIVFVEKIKKYQPEAKVLILSNFFTLSELYDEKSAAVEDAKRLAALGAYQALSGSYSGIYFFDGKKLPMHWRDDDSFVNEGHPDGLGHKQIANSLEPLVGQILGE